MKPDLERDLQRLLATRRHEYEGGELSEATVNRDPFLQFERWLRDAIEAKEPEPTAAALATADAHGKPSARIVLLRGFDERGFIFYTNYKSKKGSDIEKNPHASLLFFWHNRSRQVRVDGTLARTAEQESDEYFLSRPRENQLSAWASKQSETIGSREELEKEYERLSREYDGRAIPRPPYWGGYRLQPQAIEFWQGRHNRLHDRLLFERDGIAPWTMRRLAP